jgi:NodT family efflux transporter outer membrane factor (OMF) lipoprotein
MASVMADLCQELLMRLRFASSLLVLTGLSACTVGPDFTPPQAATPAAWVAKEPKDGKVDSKVTVESPDTIAWWDSFNDPELTSLIKRAHDSNPDLQQAALHIDEARAQLRSVDARNFPTVNEGSSYARTRLSPNGALDVFGGGGGGQTAAQAASGGLPSNAVPKSFSNIPPFDLFQTGFDASWEIDLFGHIRRQVESAEAQEQGIEEERHDVMISVYAEIARSYISLRGVQRLIAITNDNLRAQQDAYNLTHAQAQGGETSNLDVESASAEVATTAAQLPALEDQETRLINGLSLLLQLEPGALEQELGTAKPLPANPKFVSIGLPSDLAKRRPDIRRAVAQLHAATANIGVATAELYPKLTLSGSIGLQAIRFGKLSDWSSKFYNFGPSLSIPVFNGVTYANIAVQEVRQKEAALSYKMTVLSALHDVENSVSSYGAEQVRLHALERAAEANQHSLSLARQRYQAGLSSFLDVLDAERRLYASQTEVARSSVTIGTNLIAVYKALGGGWNLEDPAASVVAPVAIADKPAAQQVAASAPAK